MEKLAVSPAEAAQLLGVSKPTVYQLLRRADFPAAFKIGTRTLISRSALEKWVEAQAATGGESV